jgi:hypothetical protein
MAAQVLQNFHLGRPFVQKGPWQSAKQHSASMLSVVIVSIVCDECCVFIGILTVMLSVVILSIVYDECCALFVYWLLCWVSQW